MSSGLREILGHNAWANDRLIDVCAALTEVQLDTGAEGTFGSIRDTLVHIVEAEQHYLFRLTGQKAEPPVQEGLWPGFDVLREGAAGTGQRFERVATDDDPERVVHWIARDGKAAAMPVALYLVQTINHGNEHRSQVATILTHLGIEPPELSGWLFAIETGAATGITP
jgi:uncharacterized damage-inducible protein DinB